MKRLVTVGAICLMVLLGPLATSVSALSWSDIFWSDIFGGSGSTQTTTDTSGTMATDDTDDERPCLRFDNHEYEVCSAYIANSSLAVLVPYYKYANSDDAWQRYVTYRLGSRYEGDAYTAMSERTAAWPAGIHEVSIPRIHIVSVDSDLRGNTATIVTRESWQVTDQTGGVIYHEADQEHTVTMHRVESYILHKWVVTGIR